jgi:hypothetical protein
MGKREHGNTFRCNDTEQVDLDARVSASGLKKSDFLRQSILSTTIYQSDKEFQKELLYQLNKIGINLNQIAYHTNSNKQIDRLALHHLKQVEMNLQTLISKVEEKKPKFERIEL